MFLQGVQYTETDGVCEKEALGAYPGRCVPGIITVIFWKAINNQWLCLRGKMERDRSEWVLWQMPLYQQEIKKKSAQKKPPPNSSITQRLWIDLGRSVDVTRAIKLVCLNLPTKHKKLC